MKANLKLRNFLKNNKIFKSSKATFLSALKGKLDKYMIGSSYEKNPALADSNLMMYSELRQFQAYLTKNAYDMSIFNEYDVWPHSNFGTIDNPNLIFGAGTTWRMVICSGPGSEEESQSHEKMYMIVREGPIHRCIVCGQCFKLVKLKDDIASEDNMYYSSVFTQIANHNIGHTENISFMTYVFTSSDPRNWSSNILPENRFYAFVNPDESDHIMTDPAYRMEFYKNLEVDVTKKLMVSNEIMNQMRLAGLNKEKQVMFKDIYETWYKIERDILNFDRIYNRFEKFEGRALFDSANHERREKRMLERKNQRLNENYTFYFNGLTEKEQMYRDYYESDLEEFPDDNVYNENLDRSLIASSRDFDMDKYLFAEENSLTPKSPVDGFIEKNLFRHKYREVSDINYERRQKRVSQRALERVKNRDGKMIKSLGDKLEEISIRQNYALSVTSLEDELLPYASYVAEEGFEQFKDYYESDIENGTINKEMIEDLSERDKIKFAECYVNEINKSLVYDKAYALIPKRPFNNNQSVVSNFLADLLDFNFRVRPLARNLVYRDSASYYQPLPLNDYENKTYEADNEKYAKVIDFKKTKSKVNKLLETDVPNMKI